ncbi:hypothetical protein [Glaciecola petra]|uniref:Uncharacterized protein n=1 Tax=Glaciecola petra TaxID=3075602 RepID=A0ABU2ZM97_9ALTE|nr:hypothetical protein [Aestuariibacter sp. P117]MDT0593366.1 hypothetical protein [Aestuariibacter sp. P117]
MNKITKLLVITAILLSFKSHAAIIIYDESVSGDLTDNATTTFDAGLLSGGMYDVLGTLSGGASGTMQGSGDDEFDFFTFTTASNWTLDILTLDVTGTNGLLTLNRQAPSFSSISTQFVFSTGSDIFGTSGAGTYSVQLVPLGNAGDVTYRLRLTVESVSAASAPAMWGVLVLVGFFMTIRRPFTRKG